MSRLRPPRLRPRLALLLCVAVMVMASVGVVVLANQPGSRVPVALGAATTANPASTEATAQPRTPVASPDTTSHLRILDRDIHWTDASVGRAGAPSIDAASGILVDVDTGRILWEKDAQTPRAPASTTKVMTALVALENLDPAQRVLITPDALNQQSDETVMGIQAGDTYTVEELVDGMMLVSGNDAATALAVDTVGYDRFVKAMNEQAQALGMTASHFVSTVGLDNTGQQMSAADLAILTTAAYDASPLFQRIVASTDIDLSGGAGHPPMHLHTIDRLLSVYPPAIGVKPGYTGDAGYCLAGMARRNGHRLVAVLMDDNKLYAQTRALLEWGFGQLGVPPLPTPTPSPSAVPHR